MTNIDTLKSLTQLTYDSVEGYRKAAEKATSPALTRALDQRREKRAQTLAMLNSGLQEFGEEAIISTSVKGTIHQTWLNITDAFESGDEAATERVEEGEDFLAEQFENALKDESVDSRVRPMIETAYQDVRVGERFGDMIEKQYA